MEDLMYRTGMPAILQMAFWFGLFFTNHLNLDHLDQSFANNPAAIIQLINQFPYN